MAGSRKWFVYTTDSGTDFALNADESNTEAVNGAIQDFVPGLSLRFAVPRNIRPRSLVYGNLEGTRRIRCYALTQTIYNGAQTATQTIDDPLQNGATLALVDVTPEDIRLIPIAADTGLDDGDAT